MDDDLGGERGIDHVGKPEKRIPGKNLARENLNLMLYLNLLKLAEKFPRQPEKSALYMRQDLLERSAGEEEEEVPDPTPVP